MALSEIETLCRDGLLNAGASQEQADIVAAEIADAEAEGYEPETDHPHDETTL